MDCQEWKDRDLSEGYKQFAQDLDKVKMSFLLLPWKPKYLINFFFPIVSNRGCNSMFCI